MMRIVPAVLLALALAACSRPSGTFDTSLSTQEVMKHVIDPAAIALWDRAGELETEQGTVSLAPKTEEEWAAAEHEAAIVAEGGNLLRLPQRVRKLSGVDQDWSKFAAQMTEQALAVKTATAARQPDKMFEKGADLYQTCVECHEKYYVPFLKEDSPTPSPAPPTRSPS